MKVSHLSNSCRNYFYKSKSLIDILTLLYVWSFSLEMYSYSHINKCTVLIPYLRSICIQDQLDDESLYMLYLYPGSAGWWILYVVFVSRISWMMNPYLCYICIQDQLDDESLFPSKIGVPFPTNFLIIAKEQKQIFKKWNYLNDFMLIFEPQFESKYSQLKCVSLKTVCFAWSSKMERN